MTAAADWVVRAEGVRKRYRGATRDAVENLDLSVPRGTVFGILGPNGAGKTTTMALLSGLLRPDAGTVRHAGELGPDAARRRMGIVPQDLALYPKLTARENLAFFAGLHGLAGAARRRRCAELLDLARLGEHADERVDTFSGGMKRRLNLVSALVHDPAVLLLDEPTVGIDPQSRNRIFELILERRRLGATVLYTTHHLEEAQRLCDEVVILERGAVLARGAPREIVGRLGAYRLEFYLEAPAPGFLDDVRALDGVRAAEEADGVLSVTVPHAAAALAALEALPGLARARGVRLALRRSEEPSLESVFLDLTGRQVRDGEESA